MTIDTLPFRRTILGLAISLACASGTVSAAEINVRGNCTLINAINNANTDSDTDGSKGCPPGSGADTINLEHNEVYPLTEVHNNGDGPNGLPSVTSVITINGHGSTVSRSTAEGTPNFRLFHVAETGTLTLRSMSLKNGHLTPQYNYFCYQYNSHTYCEKYFKTGYMGAGLLNKGKTSLTNTVVTANQNTGGDGGGMANWGELVLSNVSVSDNSANALTHISGSYVGGYQMNYYGGKGGGIYNGNKATLTASTLSKNSSSRRAGGGIFNTGALTLTASTLAKNFVKGGNYDHDSDIFNNSSDLGQGGGISNQGALTLTASTLSGNYVNSGSNDPNTYYYDGVGGGIFNSRSGTVNLSATTLSGNSANKNGGGIFNFGSTTLKNVIIANSGKEDCLNKANLQLDGINLLEDGSCETKLSGDPRLGPLKYNGGPTPTHALLKESPAIDARSCFSGLVDQRGVARPQPEGGRCDLGAYERIPVAPDSVSPSVWPIADFFNEQVDSGAITGVGLQAYHKRLAALNQIVAAGNFRDNSHEAKACDQVDQLLQHIDSDGSPDKNDYITGNGANSLAEQITDLKVIWNCP